MRCSSLTIAAKCRGYYRLPDSHGSEASNLGTAFHELAKRKVLNHPLDAQSVAIRYSLTKENLEDIERTLNNININIPMDAVVISDDTRLESKMMNLNGQPDLCVIKGKNATIIDWKSGWGDVEDPKTNKQLLGYSVLVMEKYPEIETFDVLIVLPKLNVIKAARFTLDQMISIAGDIKAIITESESENAQFTVGPHCQGCFKCMKCPAFAGEIVKFNQLISMSDAELLASLECNLRVILPFAKALNVVVDKIEKVAKAWVDQNGSLDLGGGIQFVKVLESRDEIDTAKALPILTEYFQEKAIELATFSKSSIKDAAIEKERGLSGKILKRLEAEGAIKEKTITKYLIKKGVNNDDASSSTKTDAIRATANA